MIENMFTKTVRVVIGIIFIVVSAIVDIVGDYTYEYNTTVTILAIIGVLSIVSAILSVRYMPYMFLNIIGYMTGLFVISKNDLLGDLFTVLFLIIIFLAMWVIEMLISKKETPTGKIIGSLLANIVSIVLAFVVTIIIVFISVVMIF